MKLHTCMVTYNRLYATQKAVASLLETTAGTAHTLIVVDNGSTDGTEEWLADSGIPHWLLKENRYPGYACNRGWELAPPDATHLHRADNDFSYRDGWTREVERMFRRESRLGQLGLITDEVEGRFSSTNVGGNCVIARKLWDQGLRWNETPWPEFPAGWTEDSYMTPQVVSMGYRWVRVRRPCIDGITDTDPDDPYYQQTYRERNIGHILDGLR